MGAGKEQTYTNTIADEQDKTNVIAAEKYILIARIAKANNDNTRAHKLLMKSILLYPLDQAKELLKELNNDYEDDEQSRPTGTLEEADECIDKAQNAFDESNYKKALRLLTKSERIYPTTRAKNLLKQVKKNLLENGVDPDEVLKEERQTFDRKETDVPPSEPKKKEVTDEEIKEIERVLAAHNDYDILGIPNGSTLNEVKKAYNRLTKILHPDKTKAEGAKNAFMMVKDATDRLKLKLRS